MSDEDTDAGNVGHIVSERVNRYLALVNRLAKEGRAAELLDITRKVECEVCVFEATPPPTDGVHAALARLIREEFPEGFTESKN